MTTGLLDTSVVIDWDDPSVQRALPDEIAVSAVTLAELAAGPILASTVTVQSIRQARLQQTEDCCSCCEYRSHSPIAHGGSTHRGNRSRQWSGTLHAQPGRLRRPRRTDSRYYRLSEVRSDQVGFVDLESHNKNHLVTA